VNRVAEVLAMPAEEVLDSGKARRSVVARNLLSYWATKELGITQSELAKRLGLTQSAISLAVKRGAALIRRHGYSLERENDR
jgi:putative transposase